MTGYGRGEAVWNGHAIAAEVRGVNNRYLDCTVRLPRAYLFAEDALRAAVHSRASRGKIEVSLSVGPSESESVCVRVNRPAADGYYQALRELAGAYGLSDDISVSLLSRFPDVLQVEKAQEDQEGAVQGLLEALNRALDGFDAMRVREGEILSRDVLGRCAVIETLVGRIEALSPGIVEAYRKRLLERLREALGDMQPDEGRVLTEAAVYADKVAVDEETVRLRSHIAQLREMLAAGGGIGRKLDFLIQEFNREANTIASKCADLEAARLVVDMKAEIEKIREQVQNIE